MYGNGLFGKKFAPETASEVEEASTVEGMKKRMMDMSHNVPVLHHADALEHHEFFASKEDKYAWMAYQLLLQNESLFNTLMTEIYLKPKPPVFLKCPEWKD